MILNWNKWVACNLITCHLFYVAYRMLLVEHPSLFSYLTADIYCWHFVTGENIYITALKLGLYCSGSLTLFACILGQPINPFSKGQAVQEGGSLKFFMFVLSIYRHFE
jgi:hypothetical protein